MEFLCLAPSYNFTINPKFTPLSINRLAITLREMKLYRNNMRCTRVKPSALPLKSSGLVYPSDSSAPLRVNEPLPDLEKYKPGELIENNRIPYDPDELRQYLLDILASRVYDVAIESPLERATKISEKLEVNFFIKREDRQSVFSFKIRGAYNMMSSLSQEVLDKGVEEFERGQSNLHIQ